MDRDGSKKGLDLTITKNIKFTKNTCNYFRGMWEILVILLMDIKWEKQVQYPQVHTFVLKIKVSCKLDHH